MSDDTSSPLTAPALAAGGRRPAERGRGGALADVAVAAVSLLLGALGTLLALRSGAGEALPRQAAPAATAAGHDAMPGMAGEAPGEHPTEAKGQTVYISPARQQLIGVRTAKVERRSLGTAIRTVGTLAYDETKITHVNTKIAGWVDELYVNYVGQHVRRGEPLLTVYSPALVSTQREYLLALRGAQQSIDERFPEIGTSSRSLLAATRERLKLWDISDAQIRELERSGEAQRTLTLYAPFHGVVLERNAYSGMYITPETTSFRIADLSTIWAFGQIFEYEVARVRVGQDVEIEFPYGQAKESLRGKVTFVYPEVDPKTRRVKIRAEFQNRGFEFKPEAYVTLVISSDAREELALPKEAVIDTGVKRYAILAHPNGYFEPREVQVGDPVGELYPLIGGLAEGDTIATSALFLIDSETNLQAAMQAMAASMPGMDMGGGEKPAGEAGHAGH